MCIFIKTRLREVLNPAFCTDKDCCEFEKSFENDLLYESKQQIYYLIEIFELFKAYKSLLCDDFSPIKQNLTPLHMAEFIAHYEPFFWVVLTKNGDFAGFIYLYDVIGALNPHCAAVTVCFKRKYWGKYVQYALKSFKNLCFSRLKLKKIKAEVFSSNARTKGILNTLGFEKEGILKSETLLNGEFTDVELWGLCL